MSQRLTRPPGVAADAGSFGGSEGMNPLAAVLTKPPAQSASGGRGPPPPSASSRSLTAAAAPAKPAAAAGGFFSSMFGGGGKKPLTGPAVLAREASASDGGSASFSAASNPLARTSASERNIKQTSTNRLGAGASGRALGMQLETLPGGATPAGASGPGGASAGCLSVGTLATTWPSAPLRSQALTTR
jgi:hypothetical protein